MEQSRSQDDNNKSSTLTDSEWDEPFTDEDLRAIDAAFEAATTSTSSFFNKRKSNPDDDGDHSTTTTASRRRLPNSVIALQHPNAFSLSPCRQADTRMRYPALKFGGRITYSRTKAEVETAAMQILTTLKAKTDEIGQIPVGFDIEWKPTFKRGVPSRKVAVMQICGDTSSCHVMHIIHSGIPRSLQLLLESSSILKVGAGIANDSVKVFKDYNISTNAVEDLSYLANQKLGGDKQNWGLASLTEKLVCKQLPKPKKIQMGNWETEYLSKEQLQYAATDAFASWYLYEVLRSLPDVEKREEVAAVNPSEEQDVSN